jgi:hypothetical protein
MKHIAPLVHGTPCAAGGNVLHLLFSRIVVAPFMAHRGDLLNPLDPLRRQFAWAGARMGR